MLVSEDKQADNALRDLVARFEDWRHNRSMPYERIPQPLWEQAVLLSTVLPPSRVAKALRLSHNDLKKHREAYQATLPSEPIPPELHFVELAGPRPGTVQGYAIEWQRPDGARMQIQCPDSPVSLSEWVRLFLESR